MKILKSEGIVLKKSDFSEADRILTIFTREYGKKIIRADGIRKSNRREKYGTDILVLSEFVFYDKEEVSILSGVELREPFLELKKNIKKINLAIYLLVILDEIIMLNEPQKKFFDFVIKVLKYISNSNNEGMNLLAIANFLIKVIINEGIMFEIGEGNYFNVDLGKIDIIKSEKYIKIDDIEKNIIKMLLENNKNIIEYSNNIEKIKNVIIILEHYLNYNLNLKINIKEYFKEEN